MGLIPVAGVSDPASGGPRELLVYHGGSVMHGVTVHTVFWAPAGYAFSGPPSSGAPGYEQLIERFLSDAAADSGSHGNDFSLLDQYGDGAGPGDYALRYAAAADTIADSDPYPPLSRQCQSPSGFVTCVTDLQIEHELDAVIARSDPGGRGLHDLWALFLPPDVDTCYQPNACGTNLFAGYHSLFDLGHGPTVYAVIVDPMSEGTAPQGADPEGNPDAEEASDVLGHETMEAATDPEGTGWMDPDGSEVGDKCESAYGTPLGFAPDGSPYNQRLNGHPYLVQDMWSNLSSGCVQSGPAAPAPDLATIGLRQFSATVDGWIGYARGGVTVAAALVRGGSPVAVGRAVTRADGSWRLVVRTIATGAPVPVGDDRDQLLVRYGHGGPAADLVSTDGGGNPFNQAGWTGWYDLDSGYAVHRRSVALAPCSQTGVLVLDVGGRPTQPPVEACQTETDEAVVSAGPIAPGAAISLASTDDRAVWPGNPAGALVTLTVSLGEPDSQAGNFNPFVPFQATGFPTCGADLQAEQVTCTGLVAGARYTLTRRRGHAAVRARADGGGTITIQSFPGPHGIAGGDLLTLRNSAHRVLTALHVAHLRVHVQGSGSVVASGTCQPDEYWGPPVSQPPIGPQVGLPTVAGTGTPCPPDGDAAGMLGPFVQTDSFSGGETQTEVPSLLSESPTRGETVYGSFIALAVPSLNGPRGAGFGVHVTLAISRRGSAHVLLRLSGLGRPQGTLVSGLTPGVYAATWTLTDTNGDTRTVRTYFIEG